MIEIKVPSIGESVTEVTLIKIIKPEGEHVKLDEALCEFESDKATFELPAEVAGKIHWLVKVGDDLKVGETVAQIDASSQAQTAPVQEPAKPVETQESKPLAAVQANPKSDIASPAAAKLMREQNSSSDQIKGTGKDGRITKADVLLTPSTQSSSSQEHKPETQQISHNPQAKAYSRTERREKLSRMRRTIAKRLVSVKNETAMLTTFNEVDMTAILELRSKYNEAYQTKYGVKIGFMSLFAKACAQVLLTMPEVNAFIDGDELIYHDYADISIAISTPTGLVVPPIKNVESMEIHEFEKQLKVLADKARLGKLSLEEMSGGTFTITNGGVFGSLMSTPILNEPQSAILGMHATKERPVVINGAIVIRPMMYLALSYDHRVIDGSSSVTFLVRVKELLEDPTKLFLHL